MSKYEKIQIEEIIVVEGKDDTQRIQEVVDADTIETIGSAINEDILQRIELAEETRGVIVFTDPDFSGEKIRKIIMERIPTVKHAFISRKDGEPGKKGSLGVEHASDEAIITALQKVVTPITHRPRLLFDESVLIRYGLLSGQKARSRREKLGNYLRIGYTNGKQLKKRLAMFSIDESMLNEAMEKIWRDETNE